MTTPLALQSMSSNAPSSTDAQLLAEVGALLARLPSIAEICGVTTPVTHLPTLLGQILAATGTEGRSQQRIVAEVAAVLEADAEALAAVVADVATTTRKNFEPGGMASTLMFSRGIHATLGYRVTHSLWNTGKIELALALKTVFGRAFSTDIHPAARIGKGLWLDHGLGFVVGETAVIGEDVSIWHGVTLGSTLKDDGDQRHPRVGNGVTIGADAVILGSVRLGDRSVVAAGAVVLADVAADTTVAGVPARPKPRTPHSFSGIKGTEP